MDGGGFRHRRGWVVALGLAVWAGAWTAQEPGGGRRVALVIGNDQYEHFPSLVTPSRDASDVGGALARMGFVVTLLADADGDEMAGALDVFAGQSLGADMAVTYFAGLAAGAGGGDYFLPVDARVEGLEDVARQGLNVDRVIEATAGAGLRVVIHDAGRSNPFGSGSTDGLRAGGGTDQPNLFVAFSTAVGGVVMDGGPRDRNSFFADALLTHLTDPVDMRIMYGRVVERVRADLDGAQIPTFYSTLGSGQYVLGGGVSGPGSGARDEP